MLPIVNRTVEALEGVERAVERVQADDFCVSIAGNRQDEAMLARVKPVLISELTGRKAELERDLTSYGVERG